LPNIPVWQWAVGVLTQTLRPGISETPPNQPSPTVSEAAISTEGPECARDKIISTYRARIAQLQRQRDLAIIQRGRYYWYLFASLIALVTFFYLYFRPHLFPLWAVFLPTVAAMVAFSEARKYDRRVRDFVPLLDLYHRRLQRLQHEWMGKGDPGLDLQMTDHLSARDLDLFGEGSLFELLCDVQTPAGRDVLAKWLQTPAPPEEAISRQQAIRSLSDRTDLRERLALLREDEASEYSWNRLRDWLTANPVRFPRWAPWAALLLSLSLGSVAACGWYEVIEPHDALRLMAFIGTAEGALALFLRRRVRSILAGLQLPARRLESLRRMCILIERERADSPLLILIRRRLQGSPGHISSLQRLVRLRELRDNGLFFYPALLFLWSTQWTMRIERWRQHHGRDLVKYLTVLGEFEALMAIAVHAYENPADPYPEMVVEGPLFEAIGMGHPLMDVRTCVQNDLMLGRETRFLLVTGSNMSGKSTLLRAVGLNATLAWMGAPVRAARLRLSRLQVCASIRVDDSLMNGRSHFYAEVERLKAMFDCAASGPSVLFLIDELFGGTNSADRRVAAEVIIRLLVERRGIGLVTSHDLALTEISEKRELKGANVHFADLPTAEGLSFDYHLRPGKVEHSNALKIIRLIGIPLN
jgi:hypothetical protein